MAFERLLVGYRWAHSDCISVCREHAGNVKRWRDGQMALRWCAAGMVEAGKQFRRVNGHLHLPTLRAALSVKPPNLSAPWAMMIR